MSRFRDIGSHRQIDGFEDDWMPAETPISDKWFPFEHPHDKTGCQRDNSIVSAPIREISVNRGSITPIAEMGRWQALAGG
jgi:hypothetical protein